jgi:hypothetical protein
MRRVEWAVALLIGVAASVGYHWTGRGWGSWTLLSATLSFLVFAFWGRYRRSRDWTKPPS